MPGGKNLKAKVVGTDAFDDLAVISVADTSLPQAVFGKSADLKVGEQVVAIGSPLGNDGSVTVGVISALHRTISAGSGTSTSAETLQDVLQTDASINPGNSGGPLADMQGRIIGINVAVAGNTSRIGFSIPSDVAQNVAQALIARQPVKHPFLGISYLTAIDATESGQPFTGPGVLVTKVVDATPAASAGFHSGVVGQRAAPGRQRAVPLRALPAVPPPPSGRPLRREDHRRAHRRGSCPAPCRTGGGSAAPLSVRG